MPQIKKDIRQKDEIQIRCCVCSIGIGTSKIKNQPHNHIYQAIKLNYKGKIYLVDKDCLKLVIKNPKLLKNIYY